MATLQLQIANMHCGACVRRVTQILNSVPETHAATVQIGAATVNTEAAPDRLLQSLDTAGFPATIAANHP